MDKSPPNVLLITADQLRYDCVGYSEQYPVRTPNLDRLAAQSTVFHHAYSHIPVCGPARQSFLNGRRPETFGALWNDKASLPVSSLQPEDFSWTAALAENGYKSAFIGKWGVNPVYDPTSFGYSSYVGEDSYRSFMSTRYPHVVFTNGYFGESNPVPIEDSATHWLADQAIETLEQLQASGGLWHLALHFSEPHLPCRPSGRFASMYNPDSIPEWAGFKDNLEGKPYIQRQQLHSWGVEHYTWTDWAPIVARYYGIISQLDDAIGKVLTKLDAMEASENTIVIFTADHGDMCGSHRMMDKHYILYDDVVRVPLMIRLPGEQQVGKSCHHFVYNLLDMPPTLLELLELQHCDPGHLQGRSLMPLLMNVENTITPEWRDSIVATYNGQQFGLYTQRMIRTEKWKYIWNLTDVDECYELDADPAELVNQIANPENAATIAKLRWRLYEQLTADGDPIVGNEWTRHQLLDGAKL
ncbi:sulfatase [Paenibacillus baekrokdamisoli]|uniref:Sulfatase n=1 Tax=Paenibacillus baekrokdamisoli TaxID=1712516 RepID=A0A3G9J9K4_9BACL|nr:sulfatase-like hydrolase/transferase [Paenibacillus baekrokdamisoli]MBB3072490.1 arylsulfatase A-like enzyme [Paenibacillus baekrokdamisoli]BBH20548.1 sulfatase [Paenibacillus baekrokdamisoli]